LSVQNTAVTSLIGALHVSGITKTNQPTDQHDQQITTKIARNEKNAPLVRINKSKSAHQAEKI
jgi:disulfide oxidoreductase YuzD